VDFGVAKVHRLARETAVDLTKTVAHDLTLVGGMVGTLSHMSPEQLNGQSVDARSALFSFGGLAAPPWITRSQVRESALSSLRFRGAGSR
jgi:serine/threonine protein kinase